MTDPCLLRGSLAWAVDDANWDVMGWDGMGWDGMGWDAMGWDGMGLDGNGKRRICSIVHWMICHDGMDGR